MEISNKKAVLRIGGMTCVNCQNRIKRALNRTTGVVSADVSYANGRAEIIYNSKIVSVEYIVSVIEKLDYKVEDYPQNKMPEIIRFVCMLAIIIALYTILRVLDVLNLLAPGQLADTGMGYGMLFVIGLLTSVHCIAMCGGINLSQCIPQSAQSAGSGGSETAFFPALLYNLGRVASYTAIGFVLGMIGMVLGGGAEIGVGAVWQGAMKLIAGVLMIVMGVNMLNLIPGLRRLTLRMPGVLADKISSKRAKSRRPFLIGVLNGFMPCGPLQAMWIVALAAGNPLAGALSMFFFALGTVPLMLGLGSIVSALGRKFTGKVMSAGAVLVVVLGLAMLSQGTALIGWPFAGSAVAEGDTTVQEEDGEQVIYSTLAPGRYPDITVQAGVPVKWVIDAPESSINGCNYKMLLQDFDMEYTFEPGENIIEFTPEETGTISYTCWMGMIRGSIYVTDSGM